MEQHHPPIFTKKDKKCIFQYSFVWLGSQKEQKPEKLSQSKFFVISLYTKKCLLEIKSPLLQFLTLFFCCFCCYFTAWFGSRFERRKVEHRKPESQNESAEIPYIHQAARFWQFGRYRFALFLQFRCSGFGAQDRLAWLWSRFSKFSFFCIRLRVLCAARCTSVCKSDSKSFVFKFQYFFLT